MQEKRRRTAKPPRPAGATLLDRITSWWTLGVFAAACAVAALAVWLWPRPSEHQANPAAMRVSADEFPPEYTAKENLSLDSVAYPQQNLPNTRYDPPRCAEFTTQKPLAELGDGKASYGVQRTRDELRAMTFGVVDRVVSWDQFAQFAQSCSIFSMTNDFGDGNVRIASLGAPPSAADQAVSYFLTTRSAASGAKKSAAKDGAMLMVLAHVSGRTVFAGLTLQSLKPASAEQLPDKEAFIKLYATLVQRVKDNS
ncbi:hypothetical protein Srot_2012 [Segniliparus rotundus DSM 44985]|uniref:PknH-like extracellular domain-containing protein n=1 Tax=Segniliparus rotundus (strain ATCC BAA-972 / CDC 1076 / CIP 108378 / DSM 44985 / JCM 13578) TaxID=640132 RepID=D6Z938_SEGRD|nr:hypothetical protein Srot_2012 [Segniliparus rotundus DSM 44985]